MKKSARVLYFPDSFEKYSGNSAADILEKLWCARPIPILRTLDQYLMRISLVYKLRVTGNTPEERCESTLKQLVKSKRALLVKEGSRNDRELSKLLKMRVGFVIP